MKAVSKYHPLQHYQWGDNCDGWNLVDEASLSVKQELMPAGTQEVKHFHLTAQQFFYILKGSASFELPAQTITIKAGQGLHIPAGVQHKISNQSTEVLEFILCSQPSTKEDRILCD
jgi:mannose-6-phosphate isomerase-like protein (cupin superfamily)